MNAIKSRVEFARGELLGLYRDLRAHGLGAPAHADGQLIRPLLSIAGAEALGLPCDRRFWSAAAAVQLAHEASLLHDDVIDRSDTRRSAPTLAARAGVAAALVEGDHLLTTSYCLAAATASPAFFPVFSGAVERTVAGERLQGAAAGVVLDEETYRRIIAGKAGELLGCALSAAAYVADHPAAASLYALGRRMGELYQMLDDLLDYCPEVDTGKPPLADYRQQRWTWPLLELHVQGFTLAVDDVVERLTTVDAAGVSPLGRCLSRLEHDADTVSAEAGACLPHDVVIGTLVEQWRTRARAAVDVMERAAEARRLRVGIESLLPREAELDAFFASNSRTFSFAARAFPREFASRVSAVYAFCRVTDDITDAGRAHAGADGGRAHAGTDALRAHAGTDGDPTCRMRRLEVWRALARSAYDGAATNVPLLDRVMADAHAAGVPFDCVDELIEGMRMDLRGQRYATLHDLRTYSYRVAGVIGQWLTRLCGVHDADVLERAADLGHALQLTNILRDVGEDLRLGRVYLPAAMMERAGVTERDLNAMAAGAPITEAYRVLIEELMQRADEHYERALEATSMLPAWFARPVRIAAHVYRGIHDEIRAAGFDNLTRRASTPGVTKALLALRALRGGDTLPGARRSTRALTLPRRASTALLLVLTFAAAGAGAGLAAQSTVPAERLAVVEQRLRVEPADMSAHLDRVRALFFVAVDEESAVARGHDAVDDIRSGLPALAASRTDLLTAYEGAFTALEARHGFWPPARLSAVRRGLRLLDTAAAASPDDLEIRYLRMINGFYLPGLFGRSDAVREDLALLERSLPHAGDAYPPEIFRVMAEFVLEHGSPDPDATARLRAEIERVTGSAP